MSENYVYIGICYNCMATLLPCMSPVVSLSIIIVHCKIHCVWLFVLPCMCITCLLRLATQTYSYSENKPIFRDLNADEVNAGSIETTEVGSLCMECGKDVSVHVNGHYEV